jgi:anti-anti-sigma factor
MTRAGLQADPTVVWLQGEHDISTEAELCATLAHAIALDDGPLVIDLTEVQFMSTGIVGVIVRAREFLRARSRSLTVRSPSAFAKRVICVCGLADLLEPGLADLAGAANLAGALGTWTPVPALDHADAYARPTGLSSVPEHVRVDAVVAPRGSIS